MYVCEGYVNSVWYRRAKLSQVTMQLLIHTDKGKHKQTKLPDLSSSAKEYWSIAPSLPGFQMSQPHLPGDKQVISLLFSTVCKAGNSFLSFSGTLSIWPLMLSVSPTCFLVSASSLILHNLHRNSRSRFQLLTSTAPFLLLSSTPAIQP